MTTTVTKADREAVIEVIFGDNWRSDIGLRNRLSDLEGFIAGTKPNEFAYAGAATIARRAAASTQALREAAERLCVEVERLRLGGWVANAKSAAAALRSALAAETSGRDGGGNG